MLSATLRGGILIMTAPSLPMGLPRRFLHRLLHTEFIWWASLCVAAYLASRIYAVTHIPIFIDEAIHVDWARATAESYPAPDPGYEGKWFSIKLFALAVTQPFRLNDLIAARLAVVVVSLTTLLAFYLLGRELFSPRVGMFSCLFFLVLPFTVIYTSLAMTDGLQLAFGAWAILLAVRLARAPHWSYVVALPVLLAGAILAKFSAMLLLAVPVAAILLLTPPKQWLRGVARVVPTFLAALGLLAWYYSSGLLQIVRMKTIHNFNGFTDQVWTNSTLACGWLWGLLTPSVCVLAVIAGGWLLVRERSRVGLFVLTLLGITVLPYVFISKVWYPRYLLLAVIPVVLAISQLLVAVASLVEQRWRPRRTLVRAVFIFIALSAFCWPMLRSAAVLFALPRAELPADERFQLVTGWPSGYGVQELATFLEKQSATTPGGITVARTNWADHPLQGLNIYLTPSPSLTLYTISDSELSSVEDIARISTERRTLLVISTDHGVPDRLREAARLLKCSKEIWSYTRPGGLTGFVVRELSCGDLLN